MPAQADYQLTDWLPTTRKELDLRRWDECDVVMFSADAYVDHPSFGAAVLGRLIEAEGFRIAIVPQPDWHGDFRDFRKLGRPRLFFAVAPGCMDSMVNKYTAAARLRSEDAYSPDGRHDMRPEYPTIVYAQILRRLYPDAPIVLGGIEASLRRLTHFDYWQKRVRPCLLVDSPADLIVYGMGELPTLELIHLIDDHLRQRGDGTPCDVATFNRLLSSHPVRQTVRLVRPDDIPLGPQPDDIRLHDHEVCLDSPRAYAENFRHIEEESNRLHPQRLLQGVDGRVAVVEPPFPPMTTEQIDRSFDLPYTRLPHPKYRGKRIPAYEMIKFSVNIHRGCFGGCAFCTISAHQGKFIMSRSKASILREVTAITHMPDFKGYLSDLGGPSANMYAMSGRDVSLCAVCRRPSCIHPGVCPNLNADHRPLLDLYRAVDALPGIKKSFIGSGVRYDLLLHPHRDPALLSAAHEYTHELIARHVSGRLKVAPEHTSEAVLRLMRKPSFELFQRFKQTFDRINRQLGLRQQIIPYFISSHPGCTDVDMAELAAETRALDFHLEQVQDFTPTPLTLATTIWHTGLHPYTLQPVSVARSAADKQRQRMFFFWYKPEERTAILTALRRMGRPDLVRRIFGTLPPPAQPPTKPGPQRRKEEPRPTKRGKKNPGPQKRGKKKKND